MNVSDIFKSDIFNIVSQSLNLIETLLSIGAAGIVVYLFIFKRKSISSIYRILVNYTFKTTIKELEIKLEKLNDFNADNTTDRKNVINILNEIVGQMRGNPILSRNCTEIINKLSKLAKSPRLDDAYKRSVLYELRENLKYIDVQEHNEILGEKPWIKL